MTDERKDEQNPDTRDQLSERELEQAAGGFPPEPLTPKLEPPDPCSSRKR
jgi:hypothetical protein